MRKKKLQTIGRGVERVPHASTCPRWFAERPEATRIVEATRGGPVSDWRKPPGPPLQTGGMTHE
jgi:hypothetical protein